MITLRLRTNRKVELVDITPRVEEAVHNLKEGVVHLFVPHTTAGIIINENADPSVRVDIEAMLARIVPDDFPYSHLEGNSPAHVKASLVGSSVFVPVEGGRLRLGRWQGIFFCEFDGPRSREVWLSLIEGAKT